MQLQKFNHIRQILLGIGFILIVCANPATANVQTITHGKSLLISCQQALIALDKGLDSLANSDQNDAFLCMAFLGGIMSTAQHANELAKLRYSLATDGRGNQHDFNLYCFDWQLPYQKIARIVLQFGHNEPRYLQRPAHELAIRALQMAFPCR
jgi:hypothetical protein